VKANQVKAYFQQGMNSSQITAVEQLAKEILAELGRKKSAAP